MVKGEMPTTSSLALILPRKKVLKQVTHELQRNILECKRRPVKKLKQVVLAFEMDKRRDLAVSKRRVAPVDDVAQIVRGDLGRRDVQRQDLVRQLRKGQVLPALPRFGVGNLLRDVQAAIGGQAAQDNFLERALHAEVKRW